MSDLQEIYEELEYSFKVEEWKKGVAKRREELFSGKRPGDRMPKIEVDWDEIKNERKENYIASRIGVAERRAKRKQEERLKDEEWRKNRKRGLLLKLAGKENG